ncbi:UDP-N-acetylglucosamine transferase subunit ALG13-like protein [Trichoplax sp. H2]|uniref:UDP-N-acetylglucosamine transferase subunit ALG13 n=1 Tax=Trichoplax adhaerens TaxID=10228 RepID=B3RI21_TRIAD|nr:hypothetical protein TRIADDRAFT_18956 [Trichoplax adhaerens]EDV28959.1 hypothetical protein TRIADDRAFT_18956 [Trichoplax adhaerens]RDD47062.1 UDP-N-acetylglucosamine transferase subunit ALG13-like protein [Trichoplax sp. H2]|eukprot:XP_002108161.1 hypothetical protein TRIADDRAFT_18956 [Trichoplax adhaerens]
MKVVFVTVGTTSFDDLIKTISSDECCKILESRGYTKLLLQIGCGNFEPKFNTTNKLQLEYYRYKPSLNDDMMNADVILSHGGAGSILECLQLKKKLLVVINDKLSENHQVEFATKLSNSGYLYCCTCNNLTTVLQESNFSKLKKFPSSEPESFCHFLNQQLGLPP